LIIISLSYYHHYEFPYNNGYRVNHKCKLLLASLSHSHMKMNQHDHDNPIDLYQLVVILNSYSYT